MKALTRYLDSLKNLPPSGGGGCNPALFGVARLGALAGLDPQRNFDDIRRHVHGSRRVTDKEIWRAIENVRKKPRSNTDQNYGRPCRLRYDFKPQPEKTFDGDKIRQRIIDQGGGIDEADIWDASPIRIDWLPEEDPLHLFHYLYDDDDLLFIGNRYSMGITGHSIRKAADWQQYFIEGGKTYPFIIPNTLSGKQELTGDGKPSLRADACIKSFRYAVVEFDNLSREDQLAFWWAVNLPVVALIDSGNKSIHGWIRIDNITTADQWTEQVENHLFRQLLQPLGVDGACRNEARLSRLPGHKRDTGKMQRLLYLAPKGWRISG